MESCMVDFKQIVKVIMFVLSIIFTALMVVSFFLKDDIPPEEEKSPADNTLDI